jgi:PAS domain S-box-containing protein
LRTRLALIFAVATGIPLILTLALISNREETLVKDESMARLQDQAEVLAHSFDDYIEIHQSALNLLASNRSILDLSHAEQQQMLESLRRDFQDVAAISLYDASGSSLASSDPARIPTSLAGNLMFESARNNGKSALDVLQAPGIQRPVFALGDPIFDRSGKFTGLLTIELESDRIFSELNKQFESSDIEIFLVDSRGRAIATPDLSVIQSFSDLSSSPAVSKFLTGISPSGTVLYETQIGQRLASYYGIPHLGWGVIVEQPAEVALSGVNTGRDLAFGILILFLLFTTLGGIWLAGQLTTPINSLAHATKKLTSGDTHVPLPHTGIIEVQQLADAFGEMRDRLSARSAELEQALQDLQMAKEELESRIAALMQAEEKLVYQAYLLESASDAIVATNTDFKLTAWNRVAEETYGWKAEEAIGQDSFKLFRSQISRAERQRVLEVLAETGSYFGRMTQYRKDGKAIEVELRTKALKNSSGEVVGYMSVNQDITQRKQMEAELAEVKSKLIDRDEAEHLRIARELHDGPMQELYGLIFRLESMDAQKEGRQDTDVGYIKQKIQEVIQSLRTTTVTLRPPSLAPFGLERAIRGHAESLLRAHPELDLHLILMHDEQTLPERVRLALFRIYQVAITNVIRHAQAHSVQIKLTLDVEEVCLEVQDDGQGFEMPESMIELARRGHLGLVGAAERAEAVGGRLEVVSSIGKGTLVRVKKWI